MYKSFLIKYAEIAIKGKNRYLFEDALVSQINHALKKADGEFLVRKEQGRIYVDTLAACSARSRARTCRSASCRARLPRI